MKSTSVLVVVAIVLASFAALPPAEAAKGLDVSLQDCASITPAQWRCLREQEGFSFAIIEAWNGGFQLNQKLAYCVSNAWAAGFAHVDIVHYYAFLCPNCGGNNPPANAVSAIDNYLKSNNVQYGQLWFDIEQCTGCWNDDASNFAFIKQAVASAQRLGMSVGIYSSDYEWGATVGASTRGFPGLPLWYAHYDNMPSFNDAWAYSFGGWTRPAIKQYYDRDSGACGVTNIDLDWYPDN
ncbi:Lysozyme, putative [Acanthamoeba castellanii str. Neff]|uniref:Lysozyme, putative n=1 Tax=Acanthamoeba castellanii (strain ATCC 30010 / Neff) TaxID=1257118 RepID=L8HF46_ACACF|nr:Lysozyme, putative [Acanthamoeba castellanii str. Neff]ELR23388.1 Lysozyme, putative [Acanthamoeba castellanii str. Neff]